MSEARIEQLEGALSATLAMLKTTTNSLNFTRIIIADKTFRDLAGDLVADAIAVVNRGENILQNPKVSTQ